MCTQHFEAKDKAKDKLPQASPAVAPDSPLDHAAMCKNSPDINGGRAHWLRRKQPDIGCEASLAESLLRAPSLASKQNNEQIAIGNPQTLGQVADRKRPYSCVRGPLQAAHGYILACCCAFLYVSVSAMLRMHCPCVWRMSAWQN